MCATKIMMMMMTMVQPSKQTGHSHSDLSYGLSLWPPVLMYRLQVFIFSQEQYVI